MKVKGRKEGRKKERKEEISEKSVLKVFTWDRFCIQIFNVWEWMF